MPCAAARTYADAKKALSKIRLGNFTLYKRVPMYGNFKWILILKAEEEGQALKFEPIKDAERAVVRICILAAPI